MADNLVVVESPAKAKTIEKYLGEGYQVLASYGHVRDLPLSDFAVLTDEPRPGEVALKYVVPDRSKKHVSALKAAAKGDTRVWLATDLDREGGPSTRRWWTPSRRGAPWTASSATASPRCCGAPCPAGSPPAASSPWRCG